MKYFLALWLLIPSLVEAQDSINCKLPLEYNEIFDAKLKGQVYTAALNIIGTEFYNESYVPGNVYLENGEVANNQQLRYNGRIDGLLLNPGGSSLEILLDRYFIKGFCLQIQSNEKCLPFQKIKISTELGGDSIDVFAQVLYSGKLSLYVYRRFSREDNVAQVIQGEAVEKQLYKPSFVYYFKLPNNSILGFKRLRKRNLYKLFPEKKALIRKTIRENHQRRFRDDDDLTKITELLNPLFN